MAFQTCSCFHVFWGGFSWTAFKHQANFNFISFGKKISSSEKLSLTHFSKALMIKYFFPKNINVWVYIFFQINNVILTQEFFYKQHEHPLKGDTQERHLRWWVHRNWLYCSTSISVYLKSSIKWKEYQVFHYFHSNIILRKLVLTLFVVKQQN